MPLCLQWVCDLTFWGKYIKKSEKKKIIRDEKLFNRRDKNVGKKQPPIHTVNQRSSAQQPPELSLKAKLLLLI